MNLIVFYLPIYWPNNQQIDKLDEQVLIVPFVSSQFVIDWNQAHVLEGAAGAAKRVSRTVSPSIFPTADTHNAANYS